MITKAFSVARGVAITLLLGGFAMPGRAHTQRDEQIGSVRLHVEVDSASQSDLSYAMLRPDGNPLDGSLVWACGGRPDGFAAAFHIPDLPVGRNARMVWRLDGGAPDSADLFEFSGTTAALFGTPDGAPLTGRARTAARLVVQLHLDVPGRAPAEYVYTLAGVDSVAKRVGCAAGQPPSGMPAGVVTLRKLISTPGAVQPLALIQAVRLVDEGEVGRRLARSLPPVQGDGVRGRIILQFRVIEDGTVDASSIRVAGSSHPELNDLAIQAVQAAHFRPATADGRPVKAMASLPVDFTAPSPSASGRPGP